MKSIIAILVLAVIVDGAYWSQSHNYFGSPGISHFQENPGRGHGRRHNPFSNPTWYHPHHEEENPISESRYNNADWICRNPKTGDTMLITSETIPGGIPDGHNWHHYPHYPHGSTDGHRGHNTDTWENFQPVDHNQGPTTPGTTNHETVNTLSTQKPSTTTPEVQTNRPHGGEGLIDIRIGPEEK